MCQPRVTIVGAGPGGLATALLLAERGARVQLFERHPHVGGRTSTLAVDDFRFDLGPTFFLYPRVLSEIFGELGLDLMQEVPMVRLDPQYRLVFGAGGELDATGDVSLMDERVTALSPADRGAFVRFMQENREKLEKLRPLLESPFNGILDLLSPQVLKAAPVLHPWRSLGQELARNFSDPRLQIAFSFQSKYLGMSPFRCPSLFSILAFLEYEHGVFHPLGGCGAVSRRMEELARERGVEIHLDADVESLDFEGRRATGVRVNGQSHPADAVVINADFARAAERLIPDRLRKRWSDRQLARKQYSCSTFMMYLGIEGLHEELPHHTIYIARDYERNLAEIEQRGVLSGDPSFYVQNASVTDESLAPPGMSTLYVLVPVPNQAAGIDWRAETPGFRQRVLQQLERVGITDVERRIRVERVVTPEDWQQEHQIYRGATFNLAHNIGQMVCFRPRNRFEDVDGVYLVGGGTHPGSGLPVIYESARITSRLLTEDLRLERHPTGGLPSGRPPRELVES